MMLMMMMRCLVWVMEHWSSVVAWFCLVLSHPPETLTCNISRQILFYEKYFRHWVSYDAGFTDMIWRVNIKIKKIKDCYFQWLADTAVFNVDGYKVTKTVEDDAQHSWSKMMMKQRWRSNYCIQPSSTCFKLVPDNLWLEERHLKTDEESGNCQNVSIQICTAQLVCKKLKSDIPCFFACWNDDIFTYSGPHSDIRDKTYTRRNCWDVSRIMRSEITAGSKQTAIIKIDQVSATACDLLPAVYACHCVHSPD